MTKQEREGFLADLHVGIISVAEDGRGPLTVPIWYFYEPGGEVRVVTGGTSRKAQLLRTARRFSLCAQTEEDTGVDLYCTLTEAIGSRSWPGAYFAVQVKSTMDSWRLRASRPCPCAYRSCGNVFLAVGVEERA
jgi:hypothetical protein